MDLTLSEFDAAAIVESNALEMWTALDLENYYSLNGIWVLSGLSHPMMNYVFRSQLTKNNSFHYIRETIKFFNERDLPFSWITSPRSTPPGLGKQLEAYGLKHTTPTDGLILDTRRLIKEPKPIEDFEVKPVVSKEMLAIWCELFAKIYDLPTNVATAYAKILDTNGAILRQYIGMVNGEPVAIGSLFIQDLVAGIYHIGVIPEERGKGISTTLTLHLSKIAHKLGCRHVIVSAESRAFATYAALGFERICRFHTYVCQHADSS